MGTERVKRVIRFPPHEHSAVARSNSPDGPGVLGLEDTSERDRDWRVHRAGARRRVVRRASRAPRPAPARGARLSRRARRARLPAARRRSLRQHARDRSLPRPEASRPTSAASSRWRTTACIRSGAISPKRCGPARRRTSCKGGEPGMFETLYADPARLKEFLAAMTGISHGANMTIARALPVEGLPAPSSTSAPRRAIWRRRSRSPIRICAASGSTCRRSAPIFEDYVAALGVADRLSFRARQTSSTSRCRRPTSS